MISVSKQKLFQVTKKALLAGGQILRAGFLEKRDIHYKSLISPVTQIDRRAEKKIISLIRKEFPDHTFLAEESAYLKKGDLKIAHAGRYRWVIDPLDGTVNYIHHIPQSAVSIGVECDGVVMVGGVFDPFRNELFMAVRGKGATLNGKPIHVSKEKKLLRSLMITGFPYERHHDMPVYMTLLEAVLKKCMDVRRFGSASIDMAWIACGRAEGYWESKLCPWDMAAGWLLVEEAGGCVSDFRNKSILIDSPDRLVATNGFIHQELIQLLRKHPQK